MNIELVTEMLFTVIGGLTIFLLGMNNMSNGMQAVAGDSLRNLINTVTNNRIRALAVGFLVTAFIQSSSITTVMVVGFVNAGVMTLTQSIGVILGADIGTTITGWILVLNIGKYGLPLLGLAGIFYLFSSRENIRHIALTIMGIGMVFFGLELMKNGFQPIREVPEFLELFSKFSPERGGNLIICALVGAGVTAIIQSSSASVGIAMSMAATGLINFETSVALVLGMNIGTTITAFLASLGSLTNAKRAAYAHILIKVIGVIWVFPLFPLFVKLVPLITGSDPNTLLIENGVVSYPEMIKGIAIAHSIFNVANVAIFLPFTRALSALLIKLIPEKTSEEAHRLTRLDVRMLDSPMLIIEQSRREILHMGERVTDMFTILRKCYTADQPGKNEINLLFRKEEELDTMQKEIATFLVDTIYSQLSHYQTSESQSLLRIADEYESISDSITTIMKLHLKLKDADIMLTDTKKSEIIRVHDQVVSYFNMIDTAIQRRQPLDMEQVYLEGSSITHNFKDLRGMHLQRISVTRMDPLLSVSYINMLSTYRGIREYIQNVAEAIVDHR